MKMAIIYLALAILCICNANAAPTKLNQTGADLGLSEAYAAGLRALTRNLTSDAQSGCDLEIVAEFRTCNVAQYLQKYGYLELMPATKDGQDNAAEQQKKQSRKKAISLYQENVGLPVTGRLDDATTAKMMQPRCGVRDTTTTVRDGFVHKWDKSTLQWAVTSPSAVVDTGMLRSIMKKAFDFWSEVVPLDFAEAASQAQPDMQVGFGRGDHGDAWPFDGPGAVLAHATFPTDGRVHFDEDEQWVVDDGKKLQEDPMAVDLFTIATHEVGHSLGVTHLRERDAIMYPVYQPPVIHPDGHVEPPKLTTYDIDAIQRIYGPRRGPKPESPERPVEPVEPVKPVEPAPTEPQPPPEQPQPPQQPPTETEPPVAGPDSPPPTSGSCPKFQAAVNGMQGAIYFFSGNSVWKKSSGNGASTASSKLYLNRVFPGGPSSGVTAALTSTASQLTLLIQGRKVYGFTWSTSTKKFTLQSDFPKDLTPEVPFTPQGAFQWKDGNLVLYKGNQFVLWDDYWNKVTFQGNANEYFPGLPTTATAEFGIGDKLYFLEGDSYSVYDNQAMSVVDTQPLNTLIAC